MKSPKLTSDNPRGSADTAGAARRVAANSGWLLAAQLVAAALGLVEAIAITRSLGASGFGVIALVTAYVLTVSQLLGSRVWEAIIKFVPEYEAAGQRERAAAVFQLCFVIELATGLVSFVVLAATAEAAAWLFKAPEIAPLIRLMAVFALVNVCKEPSTALLRLDNRFHWLSLVQVVIATLRTAAVCWVCLFSPGVSSIVFAILLATGTQSLVLLAMSQNTARRRRLPVGRMYAMKRLRGRVRSLLTFVAYSNVTGTGRLLTAHLDTLLVGVFAGMSATGAFELAKRVVTQLTQFANPVYAAIYPEMSRLIAAGRLDRLRELQRRATQTLLAIAVAGCTAGTLLAPWIIPLLFGSQFTSSVVLFQIMIWQLVWLPLILVSGLPAGHGPVADVGLADRGGCRLHGAPVGGADSYAGSHGSGRCSDRSHGTMDRDVPGAVARVRAGTNPSRDLHLNQVNNSSKRARYDSATDLHLE